MAVVVRVGVSVAVSVGGGVPAITVMTCDVAISVPELLVKSRISYVPGVLGTVMGQVPDANAELGV